MNTIEARIAELGLVLPPSTAAMANYVPALLTNNLLFISGHISAKTNPPTLGKLGSEVGTEAGYVAARNVALALLGTARETLGSLERVKQFVRVTGMVNCAEAFIDQPTVVNGASDLFVEIFGERGRHTRAAFGVSSLPLNSSVEIDLILEIKI